MKTITGRWKAGWALDVHTTHSTPNPDGSYNTIRTPIGEAVFQLKYRHNQKQIDFLVNELVAFLNTRLVLPYIDVLMLSYQHPLPKIGIFNQFLKLQAGLQIGWKKTLILIF